MNSAFRLLAACLGSLLALYADTTVQRLEIADCDDVTFGPNADLYFACHSPEDRLPIDVRGAKVVPDEMDAYVLRWNPRTRKLVYATRVGGSSYDAALRVKVDRAGFAHATGLTKSRDFPVTRGAHQAKSGGGSDAFVVKLAPDGKIAYSTPIGGSDDDVGNGLDLDGSGNVYIGGVTSSGDFPGGQNRKASADADVFVCKIRLEKGTSTCRVFRGTQEEKLTGVALDGTGGIYAVGYTRSMDFLSKDPVQAALSGTSDLFLTRLAVSDLKVVFSTFFGGSGDDSGWGIAVDNRGNPVVAGITSSTDLPGTSGGYQQASGGKKDAFVASFRGAHRREVRTTYFGGTNDDESGYDGGSINVDGHGNIWLAGITSSSDLPIRGAFQSRPGGGDTSGFLAAFSPDLSSLCFSTYHGGPERTLLEGLAISDSGTMAAAGVSFAEAPSAFHIQLQRTSIHAGSFVFLFASEKACSN